jgi:hypothetical protein
MQLLIEVAEWLGIAFAVVIAIGLLVVGALTWLLNHPDPS